MITLTHLLTCTRIIFVALTVLLPLSLLKWVEVRN
jgi:hypothetical protein